MYNTELAKNYWEKRIVGNQALNSVLYYNESEKVNYYYDQWEKVTIGRALGKLEGKNILDLPVGIGRWTNELISRGASVDCIDISEDIINVARRNVDIQYLDHVSFYVSDVSKIGTLDTRYDYILCTGLFEHLPESGRIQCIRDFHKLLSDDGNLILVINNNNSMLIQEKKDNPYRVGYQYENGYYCELIDTMNVVNEILGAGFNVSYYSINPAFSFIRQISKEIQDTHSIDILLKKAIQIDINLFSHVKDYKNNFSDQIIIYGRKHG